MSRARDSDDLLEPQGPRVRQEDERQWMNARVVNGRPGLTVERVLVLVLCACLASENTEQILMIL